MGAVSCVDDPRVDTYTARLTKPGAKNELTFELTSSTPAPPAKGGNTFAVSVTGADGTPMTGQLSIDLKMPDHGHGTTVTPAVSFDAATNQYVIAPVYLFMPGVWRVELDYFADPSDAKALDDAVFFFCIEG